ncbi:hypothetical protein BD413DRAFT_613416 [Trametes elegans]|nr:hypothetical protein BD413DRAFT_613416 [Trametes elegans]
MAQELRMRTKDWAPVCLFRDGAFHAIVRKRDPPVDTQQLAPETVIVEDKFTPETVKSLAWSPSFKFLRPSTTPRSARVSSIQTSSTTRKPYVLGIASSGWDPETNVIHREINAQIDEAFRNIDHALKAANGKGWEQAFRVNSYHVPINNEALEATPIWTCVGVTRLDEDDMRVEIEVQAYDPK